MGMKPNIIKVQGEFLRNAATIRGFIYALLPDPQAVDDLFQDVFLVVTERAEVFEAGTNFLQWVRAIARNKVRQHRAKGFQASLLLDQDTCDLLVSTADILHQDWEVHREALRECMAKVSPGARKLLDLRFTKNLRSGQIAALLHRSVRGVSTALYKTLRQLRGCVGRKLSLEGFL